jgi:hypothetical protein
MEEIRIDRLTLKLSGLTEAEGRSLAERIAQGLAAADTQGIASAPRGSIQVRAEHQPGGDVADLSRLIVRQVLDQLRRTM